MRQWKVDISPEEKAVSYQCVREISRTQIKIYLLFTPTDQETEIFARFLWAEKAQIQDIGRYIANIIDAPYEETSREVDISGYVHGYFGKEKPLPLAIASVIHSKLTARLNTRRGAKFQIAIDIL